MINYVIDGQKPLRAYVSCCLMSCRLKIKFLILSYLIFCNGVSGRRRTTVLPIKILIRTTVLPIRILICTTVVPMVPGRFVPKPVRTGTFRPNISSGTFRPTFLDSSSHGFMEVSPLNKFAIGGFATKQVRRFRPLRGFAPRRFRHK